MGLVAAHVPASTPEELVAGLLRAQELLHSLGITAWQDAMVGSDGGLGDVSGTYRTALDRELLTARVVGALWWERDRGLEQLEGLLERREELTAGLMTASTVKIMQDGVAENHTAGMLSPYLRRGCACAAGGTHNGLSFVDPVVAARLRHRSRRARLPGALPRPRRPRGTRGARRGRGGPRRQRSQRPPAPPGPPPGRPSRRRPAVPGARRHGEHAAALGRARAADGRADHPVPGPRAVRRGSTRSATCCARGPPWRRAATGRSAARTRSRASTSR